MNVYRDYLQKLTNPSLELMWEDIEGWEATGTLPLGSELRAGVNAAWHHSSVDWNGEFPAGSEGMQCMIFMHEVWREVARRGRLNRMNRDIVTPNWN